MVALPSKLSSSANAVILRGLVKKNIGRRGWTLLWPIKKKEGGLGEVWRWISHDVGVGRGGGG